MSHKGEYQVGIVFYKAFVFPTILSQSLVCAILDGLLLYVSRSKGSKRHFDVNLRLVHVLASSSQLIQDQFEVLPNVN